MFVDERGLAFDKKSQKSLDNWHLSSVDAVGYEHNDKIYIYDGNLKALGAAYHLRSIDKVQLTEEHNHPKYNAFVSSLNKLRVKAGLDEIILPEYTPPEYEPTGSLSCIGL